MSSSSSKPPDRPPSAKLPSSRDIAAPRLSSASSSAPSDKNTALGSADSVSGTSSAAAAAISHPPGRRISLDIYKRAPQQAQSQLQSQSRPQQQQQQQQQQQPELDDFGLPFRRRTTRSRGNSESRGNDATAVGTGPGGGGSRGNSISRRGTINDRERSQNGNGSVSKEEDEEEFHDARGEQLGAHDERREEIGSDGKDQVADEDEDDELEAKLDEASGKIVFFPRRRKRSQTAPSTRNGAGAGAMGGSRDSSRADRSRGETPSGRGRDPTNTRSGEFEYDENEDDDGAERRGRNAMRRSRSTSASASIASSSAQNPVVSNGAARSTSRHSGTGRAAVTPPPARRPRMVGFGADTRTESQPGSPENGRRRSRSGTLSKIVEGVTGGAAGAGAATATAVAADPAMTATTTTDSAPSAGAAGSRASGGVSEWSHQALLPPKPGEGDDAGKNSEDEWQAMPVAGRYDLYDDEGRLVAKAARPRRKQADGAGRDKDSPGKSFGFQAGGAGSSGGGGGGGGDISKKKKKPGAPAAADDSDSEHSDLETGKGGASKGYTRLRLDDDDDAKSVTSMDDDTAYLFRSGGPASGGGGRVGDNNNDGNDGDKDADNGAGYATMGPGGDDDEELRDPLAQLQATKDLLTEGQRIAYVSVTRLSMVQMAATLEGALAGTGGAAGGKAEERRKKKEEEEEQKKKKQQLEEEEKEGKRKKETKEKGQQQQQQQQERKGDEKKSREERLSDEKGGSITNREKDGDVKDAKDGAVAREGGGDNTTQPPLDPAETIAAAAAASARAAAEATAEPAAGSKKEKKEKKDILAALESMRMWGQKMMVRLYAHMEIDSSEQVMIEQLAEHGVKPSDLTPALMRNARVKNPMADGQTSTPSQTSSTFNAKEGKEAAAQDIRQSTSDESDPPPAYEAHGPPSPETPTALPHTKSLDIDLRWTVLCDLFLVLIADSAYDSRSRALLETVGEALGVGWLDICRFEKRVTDALEMQEQAERENWDERAHMEERRKRALRRKYMMMGLATVGGSLVIGLSAGLLAPVIGAGLAAGFTSIGVAGTSTFLAGAGGAALITSIGVTTGGTIAVRASARRMGAVRTFEYRPLHNNKRVNLVVTVSGWITGGMDDVRLPFSTVDPCIGDVYSLLWEPDVLQSTGDTIKILATEALTQTVQQVLAATFLTVLMAGLSLPIVLTKLSYLLDNPWSVSLGRADSAGLILADSIIDRNLGARPITFVGFSLGSRVIFSCLKELAARGAYGLVQNVYLFGSPIVVRRDEYMRARTVVSGRFVNGFATNDWILGYLFRATAGGISRVAGLAAVERIPGLENVDVTSMVNGHMAYRTAMPKLLRRVGWEVTSDEFAEIEDPDPENHEARHRELIREIEDARKEARAKPEKRRFGLFSRGKLAKKKGWETYDEKMGEKAYAAGANTTGGGGGSRDHNSVNGGDAPSPGVLFDIDAIRRELESEQVEVRQLESTLPPMKLELDREERAAKASDTTTSAKASSAAEVPPPLRGTQSFDAAGLSSHPPAGDYDEHEIDENEGENEDGERRDAQSQRPIPPRASSLFANSTMVPPPPAYAYAEDHRSPDLSLPEDTGASRRASPDGRAAFRWQQNDHDGNDLSHAGTVDAGAGAARRRSSSSSSVDEGFRSMGDHEKDLDHYHASRTGGSGIGGVDNVADDADDPAVSRDSGRLPGHNYHAANTTSATATADTATADASGTTGTTHLPSIEHNAWASPDIAEEDEFAQWGKERDVVMTFE